MWALPVAWPKATAPAAAVTAPAMSTGRVLAVDAAPGEGEHRQGGERESG